MCVDVNLLNIQMCVDVNLLNMTLWAGELNSSDSCQAEQLWGSCQLLSSTADGSNGKLGRSGLAVCP